MTVIFRLLTLLVCLAGLPSFAAAATEVATSIADMERQGGFKARYQLHPGTGVVSFLDAEEGRALFVKPKPDASAESTARSFIGKHGKMFGITGESELTTRRITRDEQGNTFARLQQHQGGLPVIAGEIVVHSGADNNVKSVISRTTPKRVPDTIPRISPEKALTAAVAVTAKRHKLDISDLSASAPELSIYDPALLDSAVASRAQLVWKIEVTPKQLHPIRQLVLVDAASGRIALTFNQAPHAKNRVVYDKNNSLTSPVLPGTPGELKRSEGNAATGISDVDNAYDYAGETYDFYLTNHGRDSIDGLGMQLVNTVRYCDPAEVCPFQNAFWNGAQMVYGEGFSRAEDVVGHELTHGVTERTSNLAYYMQSGAINESFSDVWGEFIQQTFHPPTAANKWLIGEDLAIGASRSMKNPPAYGWTDASGIFHPDPDRMTSNNYACGSDDQGGVHSNSGINNKAVFLMTDGGSFNGKNVTGLGITKVATIYYYAQTHLLTSGSDYGDLYNALQLACTNLTGGTNGITIADCQQVKNAIDAVEMNLQPTNCAAREAPICISSTPVNVFFDDLESSGANWIMSDPAVWSRETGYAKSGTMSLHGQDTGGVGSPAPSDTNVSMAAAVVLPANAFLYFDHVYDFEYVAGIAYDGGVVEYSTDGGSTWNDAKTLFVQNGYDKILLSGSGNVLGGHQAFGGISNGYISSRLSLASLSGSSVKFRFRIATDNFDGNTGWWLDNIRIYTCPTDPTAPGAPVIGTATAGNASASVSFTAPASNGGSAIRSYTVTSSRGDTATGPASPINITGLTNGIPYTFTVTATNDIGTGPASAASNSIIPSSSITSSITVPGAPTGITATAGDTSATVSFTAPAINGGSTVTGYIVTSIPGSITATGPSSPIAVSGLTNGTSYTFTVQATNAAGNSAPSVPSNSVIPSGVLNSSYTVTPGAAAHITVSPATPQTVVQGLTTTFSIVPDQGYGAIVSGCGGTLFGTTYFTGPITQNCSLAMKDIKRSGTNGSTPGLIDAANAFRAVNNLGSLSAEDKIRYDVAPLGPGGTPLGDGMVDIADVILILRRSIGIFNW